VVLQAALSPLLLATPQVTSGEAGYGGALYVTGSLQTYLNGRAGVTFTNNRALREGGALHCAFCSYLAIIQVLFRGNSAGSGGAVCMDHVLTSSLLVDTRFVGNAAVCPGAAGEVAAADGSGGQGYTCGCGGGGALCIQSTSTLSLEGNTFRSNSAYAGGAKLAVRPRSWAGWRCCLPCTACAGTPVRDLLPALGTSVPVQPRDVYGTLTAIAWSFVWM
jgi:predicted outer membrane repeat protein